MKKFFTRRILLPKFYYFKGSLKKIIFATTVLFSANLLFNSKKKYFAKELEQNDSLFIHTFASIQDALREVKYSGADKFPSLVVIGDQSSGKSSIMESIVGVPFVPKGEGTVTKRPLIITLHKQENTKITAHFPKLGIKTDDFKRVEEIIRSNNEKFTSEPLNIDIYSPNVVDLRLIDLPGLIHNPRKDQPSNLREIINNICHPFVEPKNSVIIAVSAGNTDLQTSESLSFARKYDPNGKRTISVITKLDLLPNESIKEFMNTIEKLPTNQGFIGVKCRSKKEVEKGISLEDAREIEREFFLSTPQFSSHSEVFNSTCDVLVKKLNSVLEEKIHDKLYMIINQLNSDLRLYKEELQELGGAPKNNASDKEKEKEIIKLTKNFIDKVFDDASMEELKRELAKNIFMKVMDHCDEILYNSEKSKLIGTTPVKEDEINWWWTRSESEDYSIWTNQVSKILQDIKPIGDETIKQMNDKLKHRINNGYKVLNDYPHLEDIIKLTCHNHLNHSYSEILQTVQFLISLEKNIRPDELTIKEQIPRVRARRNKRVQEIDSILSKSEISKEEKERLQKQKVMIANPTGYFSSERDMKRYDDIYTEGYLLEVAVRLSNNIFNAVCVQMLNDLKSNLQIEVTQEVFQKHKKENLLKQSSLITQKRENIAAKIIALDSSVDKIQKLIDLQK
eukprot:gene12129-5620_t